MSTCKDASGFPGGASAGDMRDAGSIPRSGRSPGGRHGNPFQHSCLENVMDRGAWWATVHRIAQSQTRLKQLSTHTRMLKIVKVIQFSSDTQSCLTLCDPMDCSTSGFPVHHQLLELAQTHIHWVSDAIQPSHPLSFPSPPTFNHSQHQGLFKWVTSLHQVAKVMEFQIRRHLTYSRSSIMSAPRQYSQFDSPAPGD